MDSNIKCNAFDSATHLINFGEDGLGGSSEAETFSWRVVMRSDDVVEVGRRIICWRCGAREIASEPANGVLDATLLPRAVRVAKIGFQAKRRRAGLGIF